MEIIDPNTHHTLGEDTDDARSIPMRAEISLGDEYDITFGVLRRHFEMAKESVIRTLGRPEFHHSPVCTIISAIWLTWCYAAHDIARLRKRIEELESQVRVLASKQDPTTGKPGDGIAT